MTRVYSSFAPLVGSISSLQLLNEQLYKSGLSKPGIISVTIELHDRLLRHASMQRSRLRACTILYGDCGVQPVGVKPRILNAGRSSSEVDAGSTSDSGGGVQ